MAAFPPPIRGLLRAAAYPHAVAAVRVVETHISWVLLTGQYAYKIKKPVKLHFLDFSTLALRRAACQEEVRLNRRLAPELYLGVVPIAGDAANPRIDGAGPPFEYAVRMREFPQEAQLDRRLAAGKLGGDELEAFGRRLAAFHAQAASAAADDEYGAPERVHAPVRENFRDLQADERVAADRPALSALRDWSEREFERRRATLAARKHAGRVREGHGDLHLANLAWVGGEVLAFDCIEFSPALRWGDVTADVAFLFMDLRFRGRADLASRFLNGWCEACGDYDAVRMLRYFIVYRALVRAKIALLRGGADAAATASAYIDFAQRWSAPPRPRLILMHGLSGSGKTAVSGALLERLPAIRVRSDVERKRLHGLAAHARSGSAVGRGIYTAAASDRTYARLAEAAAAALDGGETAIVDAAFLQRAQRERFYALAREYGVPCAVVACRAPTAELERRVSARAQAQRDASEADRQVLAAQLAQVEPLEPGECARLIGVDTARPVDYAALTRTLGD